MSYHAYYYGVELKFSNRNSKDVRADLQKLQRHHQACASPLISLKCVFLTSWIYQRPSYVYQLTDRLSVLSFGRSVEYEKQKKNQPRACCAL